MSDQKASRRSIARAVGRSPGAVTRALAKIVDRVRTADEFEIAVSAPEPPHRQFAISGWDLEMIRDARDAQLAGDFMLPVQLARAMRTDDALFTAYHNRIAPQSAVQAQLVPASSTRGESAANRAAASVFVSRSELECIAGTMANHGIAIGYLVREVSDDGSRTDVKLKEWPLEFVRWNVTREILETTVKGGGARVTITHGDGFWVVFKKFENLPWTQEACVLPGAMIWARHSFGLADWAAASKSHGQAKIVGTLASGVGLQRTDPVTGTVQLTPEARGYLQMLQDIVSGESGAGLAPFGSDAKFLSNGSNAWQVFSELILNAEKAAARVYLGSDAYLGSVGGAPGVDIATLFSVASTKLQGDFDAIEQALYTGVYQPWTAINLGSSTYAPRIAYQLPDPDSAKKTKETNDNYSYLWAAIAGARASGIVVDQALVTKMCVRFNISDVPILAPHAPPGGPPIPKA